MAFHDYDLFNPTDEHKMLREMVGEFASTEVEAQALEFDRKEKFNLPLFKKLGELGLLGLTVPEKYGGSGQDAIAAVIVHEELSARDPGFCLAYLAHAILCTHNLLMNGSEQQKQQMLPKLSSGEWVGCMAMSEPHVGTDVLGMKSTAIKAGNDFVLNGRKMWITNGTVDDNGTPADLVLVYARSQANGDRTQLTTLLVEKGFAGYSVGQKIKDKTGMRGSNTAELVFENCKVPTSHLVGKEGESLKHMMRNLELERLTLAAMSLGIAKRSLQEMMRYACEREAFGSPLHQFGQIQRYIADSYAEYMSCRTYVYETARKMDFESGQQRLESDGAKLVSTTMGKNVADRAIQVLGGYGYVGEYVVERLWRDAKLLEIGGGTLESHQRNITRDLVKNPKVLQL